jgi:hypothetical protein
VPYESKRQFHQRAFLRSIAIARPELRQQPKYVEVSQRLPDNGRECEAWACDSSGVYRIPFKVIFKDGAWINAKHQSKIEARVVGWNYITQDQGETA